MHCAIFFYLSVYSDGTYRWNLVVVAWDKQLITFKYKFNKIKRNNLKTSHICFKMLLLDMSLIDWDLYCLMLWIFIFGPKNIHTDKTAQPIQYTGASIWVDFVESKCVGCDQSKANPCGTSVFAGHRLDWSLVVVVLPDWECEDAHLWGKGQRVNTRMGLFLSSCKKEEPTASCS